MSNLTVELPAWWEKENDSERKGTDSMGEMLHSLFEDAREHQRSHACLLYTSPSPRDS